MRNAANEQRLFRFGGGYFWYQQARAQEARAQAAAPDQRLTARKKLVTALHSALPFGWSHSRFVIVSLRVPASPCSGESGEIGGSPYVRERTFVDLFTAR
jgi:hypothetical protein